MTSYIFVTNIPTPYRNSFYNELQSSGFDFQVLYQRNSEGDRSWEVKKLDARYRHYIDNGFYRQFGYFHFHFNPRLILKILSAREADFVFGLNWNDIDLLILICLKRLGLIKNRFHFWSEANFQTIGARSDNFLKGFLRKFVFNCADGSHFLSGQMTKDTLDRWGVKSSSYISLPNTIQEEVFSIAGERFSARLANPKTTFFMPVRLKENIKGFLNFFTAIGVDNIKKSLFFVAGEGPDLPIICKFIEDNALADNIVLLGQIDSNTVSHYYRISNVFLLPSFSDPSPLSVFEAMAMALPLLISNRCGNYLEAIKTSRNGYVFDPDDHASVVAAYQAIIEKREKLQEMGQESLNIYNERFKRSFVIKKFLDQMKDLRRNNEKDSGNWG